MLAFSFRKCEYVLFEIGPESTAEKDEYYVKVLEHD